MKTPKILTLMTLMLSILILPVQAQDEGKISLQSIAEIEVVELDKEGKEVIVRKPAAEVLPGKMVIYTNIITNDGAEPATELHLDNPIPEDTIYVDGSATGENTEISFSVDDGSSFDTPQNLTVLDEEGKPRPATAEDYTHVRWQFEKELPAQKSYQVSFRVLVK
ncbi:MAG: hypothetical protein RQ722_00780 [Desulfuromonadales bacterium]|nr:hypothetical protein [Desulfuromonadales bacterium]